MLLDVTNKQTNKNIRKKREMKVTSQKRQRGGNTGAKITSLGYICGVEVSCLHKLQHWRQHYLNLRPKIRPLSIKMYLLKRPVGDWKETSGY